MYCDRLIAVVIPALNEEVLLPKTLDGMPDFVDMIIVIDDEVVRTKKQILKYSKSDDRIIAIHHEQNMGLGQSLIDGYQMALSKEADVIAIMAGDNQMSPTT